MKLLLIINFFFRKIESYSCSNFLKKFSTDIRVRYGETDQMGIVYNGNYATYFEIARTEWLRNLGITYKGLEESGIMLPVISLSFNFIKPALYDDILTVTVTLNKKPLVKIDFDYEIINQNKEKISTGNSVLAFINMETNKPMKCPDYIHDKLDF